MKRHTLKNLTVTNLFAAAEKAMHSLNPEMADARLTAIAEKLKARCPIEIAEIYEKLNALDSFEYLDTFVSCYNVESYMQY